MPENEKDADDTEKSHKTRNDFGKMLVGSVIGFIATAIVEKGYDTVVEYRRLKKGNKQN